MARKAYWSDAGKGGRARSGWPTGLDRIVKGVVGQHGMLFEGNPDDKIAQTNQTINVLG